MKLVTSHHSLRLTVTSAVRSSTKNDISYANYSLLSFKSLESWCYRKKALVGESFCLSYPFIIQSWPTKSMWREKNQWSLKDSFLWSCLWIPGNHCTCLLYFFCNVERQGDIGTLSAMCRLYSDKIRFIYQPFIHHFDWPTNIRAEPGGTPRMFVRDECI